MYGIERFCSRRRRRTPRPLVNRMEVMLLVSLVPDLNCVFDLDRPPTMDMSAK